MSDDYHIDADGIVFIVVHGRKWTMREIVDWWTRRGQHDIARALSDQWAAVLVHHHGLTTCIAPKGDKRLL